MIIILNKSLSWPAGMQSERGVVQEVKCPGWGMFGVRGIAQVGECIGEYLGRNCLMGKCPDLHAGFQVYTFGGYDLCHPH